MSWISWLFHLFCFFFLDKFVPDSHHSPHYSSLQYADVSYDVRCLRAGYTIAYENSRLFLLLTARDISSGEMSAPQQQKLHTDEPVRNLVRSSDWL